MGNLTINSASRDTNVTYKDEESALTLNAKITEDPRTGDILSINGTIMTGAQLLPAGTFNARRRSGELTFGYNGVSNEEIGAIVAAVTGIINQYEALKKTGQ